MRWVWLVSGCLLALVTVPVGSATAGEVGSAHLLRALVVQPDPDGGVRATATLLFPGGPAVLHSILSEYHKWPELFETRMRVAQVEERDGRVLTDIYISHALLPGEQRLLCESQALPGGGSSRTSRGEISRGTIESGGCNRPAMARKHGRNSTSWSR